MLLKFDIYKSLNNFSEQQDDEVPGRIAALLKETGPGEKVVQSVKAVQMQMLSSFLNIAKYHK